MVFEEENPWYMYDVNKEELTCILFNAVYSVKKQTRPSDFWHHYHHHQAAACQAAVAVREKKKKTLREEQTS